MKVLTVVGARPQFIKAAVVSDVLNKSHEEIIVHTGQHYDYNMSGTFFEELSIPDPDYNLGISGGTHAEMTGQMMMAIEKVLLKEEPDWLLVYGDTNSTLAAALSAAKLHVPICHVEAGVRVHSNTNPEEINRVCTDHVSTKLLYSTKSAEKELIREGLSKKAKWVGDPMYDAFIKYSGRLQINDLEIVLLRGERIIVPNEYYFLTCHREENTNNDSILAEILKAMDSLDAPTIFPVHPRNQDRAKRLVKKYSFNNIILSEPVGYLESVCLIRNCKAVVTDSGGVQREAFFSKRKCVSVLNFVVWPETMVGNRNILSEPKAEEIIKKLDSPQIIDESDQPFGDGHAANRIVKALEESIS